MKTRLLLLAALVLAVTALLVPAAPAAAAPHALSAVSAAGIVGFDDQGTEAYAKFYARATAPAAPGEMHQPASGVLTYSDKAGLRFWVSVEHIHDHSATEVHFGGPIERSNDPSLVGKFAHTAAVDGGLPKGGGDLFAILVTDSATCPCDNGMMLMPMPITAGNLVVQVPVM
jgi:hypothetical protein